MLPQDLFVPGLASFLVGHIAFIVGMLGERDDGFIPLGIAGVAITLAASVPTFRAVHAEHRELEIPVFAYATVIAAMFLVATRTGNPWAIAGATSFVVSDSLLARNRFVRPIPHGHLAVMVTYHAALVLLVLSLV